MMAAFTWIITFVSLTGTVLNVRKNILCFYLWAVGEHRLARLRCRIGSVQPCCAGYRPFGVRHLGDIRVEEGRNPPIQVMGVE